jgi:hypothetical protein
MLNDGDRHIVDRAQTWRVTTLKLRKFLSTRAIITLGCFLTFGCVAEADVFNVSGNFGTTFYTGPLDGGTFAGTFTATLPVPSGGETITTYDIVLRNSSNVILGHFDRCGR